MLAVVTFIIGALLGCVITGIAIKPTKPKCAGILRLYEGEEDGGIGLYLELDETPESLLECKDVNFKIRRVTV